MNNLEIEKQYKKKSERRENKKKNRRNANGEDVIFIFEKILEGWKTIRIYNTIIQNNPNSEILKKNVENISTGNSKVYENELPSERYNYYKVYQYHINKKINKNNII